MHWPGPVVATSTKPDLFALTCGLRARGGPGARVQPAGHRRRLVHVPVESRWQGCEEPAVAIRRADAFAQAWSARRASRTARSGPAKASRLPAGPVLRGRARRLDMRDVAGWVLSWRHTGGPGDPRRARAARSGPASWPSCDGEAPQDRRDHPDDHVAGRWRSWPTPARRSACCPARAQAWTSREFLQAAGTLYLIAEPPADDEAPLAPLFACLAGEIQLPGGRCSAAMQPGGRLDPPLLMGLDEATADLPGARSRPGWPTPAARASP